jgi:hypothetical protein
VTEALATETFVALRALGFGEHDRVAYRVVFQVERIRTTTDLAAALRKRACDSLRIRPASLHPLRVRQWSVAFTTPALPLRLAVLRSLEGEMQAVAQRHPGAKVIALQPLLGAEAQTAARPAGAG